jgi:hypothetical protein
MELIEYLDRSSFDCGFSQVHMAWLRGTDSVVVLFNVNVLAIIICPLSWVHNNIFSHGTVASATTTEPSPLALGGSNVGTRAILENGCSPIIFSKT